MVYRLTPLVKKKTQWKRAFLPCRARAAQRDNLPFVQSEMHCMRIAVQSAGLEDVSDDADAVSRRLRGDAALYHMIGLRYVFAFNEASLALADMADCCCK